MAIGKPLIREFTGRMWVLPLRGQNTRSLQTWSSNAPAGQGPEPNAEQQEMLPAVVDGRLLPAPRARACAKAALVVVLGKLGSFEKGALNRPAGRVCGGGRASRMR